MGRKKRVDFNKECPYTELRHIRKNRAFLKGENKEFLKEELCSSSFG
jgi:hypothetical protein